jgi:hypothetical protein
MKKLIGLFLFAFSLCVIAPGCESSQTSEVAVDAEQSAIDAYDANLAAEQNAMDDQPPEDL